MTNQTIDTKNLVTECFRNIELPSDFDLPFLGKRNLKFLADYYILKEANTASRAGSFQSETNPSEDNKNPLLQEEDEELYKTIDTIIETVSHAERKPPFATIRYDRWFNNDDEVVCFIQDDDDQTLLKKNVFVTGKVFANWTQQEGYVSVLANEKVYIGYNHDWRGLGFIIHNNPYELRFTTRDPRIMKVEEYNYLKNHPDYLKMWITCHPSLPQFNPESMLQAFAEQ